MSTTEVVHVPQEGTAELARFMPVMSMELALDRRETIVKAFQKLMTDGVDYGPVPGSKKPTLLQPGAQKLDNLFGLVPRFSLDDRDEDWSGEQHGGEPFFRYLVRCQLMRGEFVMGEGIGECNSWESKYRFRIAERVCPNCGHDTIIKTKKKSWWCAKFKGGCNAGFEENDERITGQDTGRKLNPEIFDQVNTLLKMAQKRAHVAATINATSASEFFTQDMEDRGSEESQDEIRDRRLTEERAKSAQTVPATAVAGNGSGPNGVPPSAPAPVQPIPEELTIVFQNLSKSGGTREAFEMMRRELSEVLPNSGAIEYERIGQKHGMRNGSKPISAVKACLLEMWGIAQMARKATAAANEIPPEHPETLFENPPKEAEYGV